jgi:hypothetical protein
MNEAALRELTHKKLADGRLPSEHIMRFQAGYGDGAACAGCGLTMLPSEIAYRLTYGETGGFRTLTMHYQCFCMWERERSTFHRLTGARREGSYTGS